LHPASITGSTSRIHIPFFMLKPSTPDYGKRISNHLYSQSRDSTTHD
jgi:hypothetical protein